MEIWFLVAAAFAASYLGLIAKHVGMLAEQARRIADQLEGEASRRSAAAVDATLEEM
jgi:hypothetical protein